jgi:hypothetical protein
MKLRKNKFLTSKEWGFQMNPIVSMKAMIFFLVRGSFMTLIWVCHQVLGMARKCFK